MSESTRAGAASLHPSKASIVEDPSPLPPVWTGSATPDFPDRLLFNLTALRAELALLIHRAKAYRAAWGFVEDPPDAFARVVRNRAWLALRYYVELTHEVDARLASLDWFVPPEYMPPLGVAGDCLRSALVKPPVGIANALSDPEALRVLESAYALLPSVRFSFDAPGGPAAPSQSVATKAPAVAPPKPHEGEAIDFAGLASALRKAGKPIQAALVEYMADKTEATAEDVAKHVHKDSETTEKAMRNRADQTNKSLEDMGSPVRFRLASARMFREILPE